MVKLRWWIKDYTQHTELNMTSYDDNGNEIATSSSTVKGYKHAERANLEAEARNQGKK